MSDDVPTENSDTSHAKKRLARDLRIIVLVQVVALGAFVVGLFFFGSNRIPNYPEWDEIHLLCGVLALAGAITFFVAAFWGFDKLQDVDFQPIPIQVYRGGGCGISLFFILCLFLPCGPPIYFPILLCFFPFYCVVPQFFIARWLAKEAKDGTMSRRLPTSP